jgi:lactoylglutathione lyase
VELTQIRLVVTEFATAFDYYRDVIGLTPQDPAAGAGPYAAFKPEWGSTLALHDRADLAGRLGGVLRPAGGDGALVAFRVPDLAEWLAAATERGARPLTDPVEFGRLRTGYLRDPEGTLLEIQQWLT